MLNKRIIYNIYILLKFNSFEVFSHWKPFERLITINRKQAICIFYLSEYIYFKNKSLKMSGTYETNKSKENISIIYPIHLLT